VIIRSATRRNANRHGGMCHTEKRRQDTGHGTARKGSEVRVNDEPRMDADEASGGSAARGRGLVSRRGAKPAEVERSAKPREGRESVWDLYYTETRSLIRATEFHGTARKKNLRWKYNAVRRKLTADEASGGSAAREWGLVSRKDAKPAKIGRVR
jgi:hypothetical protein